MKHLNYLAAFVMSAAMLSSCSNDDVISAPAEPNVIGFKAMANKTSRAEVTTGNIDRFRVFGCVSDNGTGDNHTTIFDNTTVDKKDGVWSYTDTKYWAPNKDYFFVALSTNNMNPVWEFTAPTVHETALDVNDFTGYGTVSINITKETSSGTANGDRDLVYATATRATDATISNSSAVDLTFKHLLSRIAITFENAIPSSAYSLNIIPDVKISGLYNEGTIELGENLAWEPTGEATTVISTTVPSNNNLTNTATKTTSESRFIIPSEQELTISFNVQVKLNGVNYSLRTLTGKVPKQTYEIGHSYMFTAKITTDNISEEGAKPIEFNVTDVEGWGDDTPVDIVFPDPTTPTE